MPDISNIYFGAKSSQKECKTTHSSITIGRRQSDHLIVIGQQFEGDSLTLW